MEAEYIAMATAAQQLTYLRMLLESLGVTVPRQIRLHCDNQGAIASASHMASTSRAKHIDVRYHYIRERVAEGSIQLVDTATGDMIADIFTKPVSVDALERHIRAVQDIKE